MKNIVINNTNFTYKNLDIQTSIIEHVTLHLTLDRKVVNEKVIFDLFDRQDSNKLPKTYKFDVRHSLGSFYGCSIKKLDTYKDDITLEIISDYNNAKPLQQHRMDFIENVLSTPEEENTIKSNNTNNNHK
jgi:hypothetical protein